MGMSTHVVAFKPADDKWRKMKAVWDTCKAAGVNLPTEVEQFFNWTSPDPNGVQIEEKELENSGAVRKWRSDSATGYEILVDFLPKDVKIVRVYNSW
jgi:hypothetical protein